MRNLVIVFFLQDGKVFQTITLGHSIFTAITADTAFRLDCKAVVYLDGERMEEQPTNTAELFSLLCHAAAQGYPHCSACSR